MNGSALASDNLGKLSIRGLWCVVRGRAFVVLRFLRNMCQCLPFFFIPFIKSLIKLHDLVILGIHARPAEGEPLQDSLLVFVLLAVYLLLAKGHEAILVCALPEEGLRDIRFGLLLHGCSDVGASAVFKVFLRLITKGMPTTILYTA